MEAWKGLAECDKADETLTVSPELLERILDDGTVVFEDDIFFDDTERDDDETLTISSPVSPFSIGQDRLAEDETLEISSPDSFFDLVTV